MKLNFKRILPAIGAIAAGLSLVFAPVAHAATLADWPAPFVQGGQADVAIITGAAGNTLDSNAASVISSNLAYELCKQTASGGTTQTVVTGGESAALYDGGKLYFKDSINSVVESLDENDLPIMEGFTFIDDGGSTYDVSQFLEVGDSEIKFIQEETGEDPILEIDVGTNTDDPLYTMKITFSPAINFTDSEVKGNSMTLFGVPFTIAGETTESKLVLYKASTEISLQRNESTTVTINGVEYTIRIIGFNPDNDEVVVEVNGVSDDIVEGNSKKINDLQVYAKSVTSWSLGAEGVATLLVGSEKIVLQNGDEVRVGDNEEPIDGTYVKFNDGSSDSVVDELSSITISVAMEDSASDYIAKGSEFKDPVFGTFKVAFAGVSSELEGEDRDLITLTHDGTYRGYITVKGKDGKIYFVKGSDSANNTFTLTNEKDEDVYLVEGDSNGAEVDQYDTIFINPSDHRYGRILMVTDIDIDSTNGKVELTDVLTNEKFTSQKGNFSAVGNILDLYIDGKTYKVNLTDTTNEKIKIWYNDSITVVYPTIQLPNGELLAITKPDLQIGDDLSSATIYKVPTGYIKITPNATGNVANISVSTDGTSFTLDASDVSGDEEVIVGKGEYIINIGAGASNTVDVTISLDSDFGSGSTSEVTVPAVMIVEEDDINKEGHVIIVKVADGTSGDSKTYASYTLPTKWTSYYPSSKYASAGTSSDDVTAYLDYYGTYMKVDATDDDHTKVYIYYPDNQLTFDVLIAEEQVTITTGTGEATGCVELGDVTYADTEVEGNTEILGKNLVVIGGSAVNKIAAQLLGVDFPTYGSELNLEGFGEGKAYVKMYDNPWGTGKVALLIMGWEGPDTKGAANQLVEGKLSGTEQILSAGQDYTTA